MSRQNANAAFALSSFLQGANATYIDELYARYEKDSGSVDPEWQEFFKSLKDSPEDVRKNAKGPSWEKANWPPAPQADHTSALDGHRTQAEKDVGPNQKAVAAKLPPNARGKGPPGAGPARPRLRAVVLGSSGRSRSLPSLMV